MERALAAYKAFRSSKALITFTVAYAVFTDQFLFAAIIPVAPFSLHTQIGIPEDKVQFWTAILLAVFGIAAFVTSVPWGWYTDRSTSRRMPFTIGLLILLGATFMLWFGNHIVAQVIGRLLQGFSSTVVWTTGLAVLVDTVGHGQIGEYMGYVGIALNVGSLIAPLLGGVMYQSAGFNAVFGMIVGVVVLDILLRFVMKEKSLVAEEDLVTESSDEVDLEAGKAERKTSVITVRPVRTDTMESIVDPGTASPRRLSGRTMSFPSRRPSDAPASPLAAVIQSWRATGITTSDCPLQAVEEKSSGDSTSRGDSLFSGDIIPSPEGSNGDLRASLHRYSLQPRPQHPPSKVPRILRLLCSTRMTVTLWSVLVLAGTFSGFQATLPLFVSSTFHWNATGGGLVFLPLSAPALVGPAVGKLQDRFAGSGRWFAFAGFAVLSVALILLRLVEHNNTGQKALLIVLLTLIGSCMPLALEPLFGETIYGADQIDLADREAGIVREGGAGSYGQANALFNMAWAGGCALGPVLAGTMIDHVG
ncbi:hypothetical protein CLAFUW4_11552 [Fulvia fulva]|uniref:Major facilitator superfamily (MFS) profile domain-containing protein n=1 Tax=Passalora fulva TaxID=5499 RepID=A0A9Q8URR9_PASFU|nr:uncharacterized protein CLAFUR5_10595 [Fulvia fulva]KAK4620994.1 hypothetical protein CLAFUR0_11566 [Fulvia fulva]UJO20006.1 hypothetical protein CLAFUR5_10595 [Fulvia fulva]WPV17387.1 hypothetical protein CLAFUW4_11552 [Fulvia fulva]